MTENSTAGEADSAEPLDADVADADAVEAVEADAAEADDVEPTVEPTEETVVAADAPRRRGRRLLNAVGGDLGVILLLVAMVAALATTAALYFVQFRPDQQTNANAAQVVVDAAANGAVALLSYSPDSLDHDFAAGKSHLTGDFLNYYTQFTEQIVTPAAKDKQVKTSATVVQAAPAELHPDSAVVLLFINQTTVSKENPDGAFAASAVKVALKKIDGNWLISAFDPV